MASEQKPAPTDPSSSAGTGEGPSKSALKKAEAKAKKEAEKARKAAEREREQKEAQNAQSLEDLAKGNYGDIPKDLVKNYASVRLEELSHGQVGKEISIRGIIRNSRMQGAKMAFIELVKGGESIQGKSPSILPQDDCPII